MKMVELVNDPLYTAVLILQHQLTVVGSDLSKEAYLGYERAIYELVEFLNDYPLFKVDGE